MTVAVCYELKSFILLCFSTKFHRKATICTNLDQASFSDSLKRSWAGLISSSLVSHLYTPIYCSSKLNKMLIKTHSLLINTVTFFILFFAMFTSNLRRRIHPQIIEVLGIVFIHIYLTLFICLSFFFILNFDLFCWIIYLYRAGFIFIF